MKGFRYIKHGVIFKKNRFIWRPLHNAVCKCTSEAVLLLSYLLNLLSLVTVEKREKMDDLPVWPTCDPSALGRGRWRRVLNKSNQSARSVDLELLTSFIGTYVIKVQREGLALITTRTKSPVKTMAVTGLRDSYSSNDQMMMSVSLDVLRDCKYHVNEEVNGVDQIHSRSPGNDSNPREETFPFILRYLWRRLLEGNLGNELTHFMYLAESEEENESRDESESSQRHNANVQCLQSCVNKCYATILYVKGLIWI